MTPSWLDETIELAAGGGVVRAVVIEARGSTPREVGAHMLITANAISGTIGGGALEFDVIARARALLTVDDHAAWLRQPQAYQLGPELAQCCGGRMRLLLERFGPPEVATLQNIRAAGARRVSRPLASGAPPCAVDDRAPGPAAADAFAEHLAIDRTPLVIYGAGHVGRAVVAAVGPLPFAVSWVDVAWDRFPALAPQQPLRVCVADPTAFVANAPAAAMHLVMTHSHTLDEAIVGAVLERGDFAYLGLIGSDTKRARFAQRLARRGVPQSLIERLCCPIGLPGIVGKAPAIIAASVAADLLRRRNPMAAR